MEGLDPFSSFKISFNHYTTSVYVLIRELNLTWSDIQKMNYFEFVEYINLLNEDAQKRKEDSERQQRDYEKQQKQMQSHYDSANPDLGSYKV